MPTEWKELTSLTAGRPFRIERVRLADNGIAIEGDFELRQMARLTAEDQVFVSAFIRCSGSIKDMEKMFGVSYPTIKSRLARIASSLEFVEMDAPPAKPDVLDMLERGEITPADAVEMLKK